MDTHDWDRSNPFTIDVVVTATDVDGYGHVSTHRYVRWLIDCAFAHSEAVGLPETACRELSRGMAAREFRVELLASAYEGDSLKVANWISHADGKLRASRQFQIINVDSGKTLVRGMFDFVCTNLENGRPAKMPAIFAERYIVESEELNREV